jgi:hypothetical protein
VLLRVTYPDVQAVEVGVLSKVLKALCERLREQTLLLLTLPARLRLTGLGILDGLPVEFKRN